MKADVNKLLGAYPNMKDRLLLRYSSDVIAYSGGKHSPLKLGMRGVDMFNIFNRTQEYVVRRAVFLNSLDALIRGRPDIYGKGMTLTRMLADEKLFHTIRQKDLASAIDIALEVTYASPPKSGFAKAFVKIVNDRPFTLALLAPFPRFLVNSLRFLYEYSPLPTIKGGISMVADIPASILNFSTKGRWTPEFLKKLQKGDMKGISKSLVGWGLFGTAYLI